MCGRYTLSAPGDAIIEAFALEALDLQALPDLRPRYNIAPTQEVAVVRLDRGSKKRRVGLLKWGLVPSWAADPSIGNRMINARAETVAEKPSFRSAFKRQRCLVVADGYYEWKKLADGSKQPYFLRLEGGKPFGIAGLWEHWEKGEPAIDSCTLLTTSPNEKAGAIHDRMPVILDPHDYDLWLDTTVSDRERLEKLLVACPAERMEAWPVSRYVNSPANDSPKCVEPVAGG